MTHVNIFGRARLNRKATSERREYGMGKLKSRG